MKICEGIVLLFLLKFKVPKVISRLINRDYEYPTLKFPVLIINKQFFCRSGLCLPHNLDLSDIYIETPSGSIIKYQDREIESNLFKVI